MRLTFSTVPQAREFYRLRRAGLSAYAASARVGAIRESRDTGPDCQFGAL